MANTNGKIKKNTNFVFFPIQRYATINCEEKIININFDEVLREIGKFYFKLPDDVGLNRICSMIKDKINKTWHLNRLRKRAKFKNVTTNQIKSIRHSFNKLRNNADYIRIPFNVVSILFFIICMYVSQTENPNFEQTNKKVEEENIGDYFYKEHLETARNNLLPKAAIISDPSLAGKYTTLYNDLTNIGSLMEKHFSDIDWNVYKKDSDEHKIIKENDIYKIK